MVTLLLGPYGHGKSTYIIDKIKADYENGVRSFLIVPEQQTVVAERQLTESLPPKAQLYTEATNLTRLANSVFRKTGAQCSKEQRRRVKQRSINDDAYAVDHFIHGSYRPFSS